ncbi:MAG TPA: T9SS type A sorting domain-containing protein, partial [Flavobacterium sp.]|nr:T9SS type A sorting domain-containing protein [Flavobacterium sp.]
GWPGQANNPGPIDVHQMTTTDGVTYTLNNLPIVPGQLLFRTNNAWDVKYGDTPFPTGSGNGANNIVVPPGSAGTYNVTLDVPSKTYTFSKITYSIVGEGVGGWPGEAGNPGPIDVHQLSTVDGINYTSTGLVVVGGGAKFRLNNAWAGGDWGGDTFPAGTKTGNNIPTVAGTYNLTVNVLTGAYDFGTALGTQNFDASSFRAYPNPTRGSWNITSGNDDITSIQVYDVQGKAVYTKFGASKEVSVNASELSKGVYFAKVSTSNGTSTLKLVKE